MKKTILERIKALGGDIEQVKGKSLKEDLLSITFTSVLYKKTEDTPWATAEDQEPIHGIGDFIDQNKDLFQTDKAAFYNKIIDHYYQLTEEPQGQTVYQPLLFTPLTEGTADYEEWSIDFLDEEEVDLSEIKKVATSDPIELVQIVYSYGFPDHLYICTSDKNHENPTVFGTDHEVFFSEVDNLGSLETYFNSFMTKEELIEIVKTKLEK